MAAEPFADRLGDGQICIGHHDDEFFPAIAAGEIDTANAGLHAGSELAQDSSPASCP